MEIERVERRLSAILAVDIAGYSRLMGADEEGTLARLKAHRRDLVDLKIAAHRGRVVKTTGDGMLVEFASVVDAVRCAVDIQRGMIERNADQPQEQRIEFRAGINVGDIIIDDGDIYGDGVNIAARLEGIAPPGGICVSARVQEDVFGKCQVEFVDKGEHQLKNIARPVRIYEAQLGAAMAKPILPLPDKPSIAVLPFQNMSGDPEQEYFADGMVEEITTALSRFPRLLVIARNSSFTYKAQAVDVTAVGRELGARYVLEGSVRKAGQQVRITAQLIEARPAAHLWADRFEDTLKNIFEVQDQVTTRVVNAIAPMIEHAEIERAKRKPTQSLVAYDYYLRGLASHHQFTREGTDASLKAYYQAIELDPQFAEPYALAAGCYILRRASGWMLDRAAETAETERLAERALQLAENDAVVLIYAGAAIAFVLRRSQRGLALIERGLGLNPNFAEGWALGGWVKLWTGNAQASLEYFKEVERLSPRDPRMFHVQNGMAHAYFFSGHYDEAASCAETALGERPDHPANLRIAAASHAAAGRIDAARDALDQMLTMSPGVRVSGLKDIVGPYDPQSLQKLENALRAAGLPE